MCKASDLEMSQISCSRLSAVLANSYGVTHGGSQYLSGTVPRCEYHARRCLRMDTCKVEEENCTAGVLNNKVTALKPFSVQYYTDMPQYQGAGCSDQV